jgi:hypothetical protein
MSLTGFNRARREVEARKEAAKTQPETVKENPDIPNQKEDETLAAGVQIKTTEQKQPEAVKEEKHSLFGRK